MKAFYLNLKFPTREIKEVEVTIVHGKKKVWAKLPDGKLRLLGASIFFTLPSAARSQKAILQKIVKDWAAPWNRFAFPYAKKALKDYGYLQ